MGSLVYKKPLDVQCMPLAPASLRMKPSMLRLAKN